MKQKITLTSISLNPFRTPSPFRVWCHPCQRGFMSIAESQLHNHQLHQNRNSKPKPLEEQNQAPAISSSDMWGEP